MTEQIQTQKPNAGAGPAMLFFKELMENVETLTGIADLHGARTLADMMYLQNAILDGTFIELYPDESAVLKIVDELPSSAIWRRFIQMTVLERPSAIPESKLLRDAKQLVADIQAMAQPVTASKPEADLDGNGEFENHYLCTCGEQWQDTWSSACNDRCPACNREIEPYASDDGSMTDEEIDTALKRVADMRQYLIADAPSGWAHIFAGFGEFVVRFVFDRDGVDVGRGGREGHVDARLAGVVEQCFEQIVGAAAALGLDDPGQGVEPFAGFLRILVQVLGQQRIVGGHGFSLR